MNLPELLKIAEAATPGEWRLGSLESYDSMGVPCRFVYRSDAETANSRIRIYSGDMESTPFDCDADAAHIAAFNPSVAIELIKRLQEAEKDAERYRTIRAGACDPDSKIPDLMTSFFDDVLDKFSRIPTTQDYDKVIDQCQGASNDQTS